jgi:hypothetical protein
MADNFTPAVKKPLREAGCRFERQGKGDHEICIARSPNGDLWSTLGSNLDIGLTIP